MPGELWTGGHVNTGIAAPSTSWFHAEGATGAFFNTFILLSNPQDDGRRTSTLRFLLEDGDVDRADEDARRPKQRLTINPAAEGDPRLENAAVSTVVQSDVPIVSERSMYWPGDAHAVRRRPQQLRRRRDRARAGASPKAASAAPRNFDDLHPARESDDDGGAR